MDYCEDCGTKLSDGACSNCQEELYIYENQYEYMDKPISDEFMAKVVTQENDRGKKVSSTNK